MNVLVLNAGSSTLKFQLISTDAARMATHADEVLARGVIERVGGEALYSVRAGDGEARRGAAPMRDLRAAVRERHLRVRDDDPHRRATIA